MKRCLSYPSCHRRGLTLIEVIASIGLLSTLLVGALLSHGKLAEQSSRDRRRIAAIELADELLQSWVTDGVIIPVNAQGDFTGDSQLTWYTQRVRVNDRPDNLQIVRLTIQQRDSDTELFHIDLAAPNSGEQF